MKLFKYNLLVLMFTVLLFSCSSDDDSAGKDQEKPEINIAYEQGFPKPCIALVKGQTYTFKAMVSDNDALAAYSLDIHHNFDHHTHDDQEGECDLEAVKQPENPWIFMENYDIEDKGTEYEITLELTVPTDIDTGDYHCSYSVTDQTGWQSRTAVDIKITD